MVAVAFKDNISTALSCARKQLECLGETGTSLHSQREFTGTTADYSCQSVHINLRIAGNWAWQKCSESLFFDFNLRSSRELPRCHCQMHFPHGKLPMSCNDYFGGG